MKENENHHPQESWRSSSVWRISFVYKKTHDRTRTSPSVYSQLDKAYPFIGCVFSLVSYILGHEHVQAHMHTLNQQVQMQENTKTLFIPGYVSQKCS